MIKHFLEIDDVNFQSEGKYAHIQFCYTF